jgi:DNA topoisomerase VI subunit B
MVVPNALPFDSGQFTRSEDRYSKSKVVYVAGKSHIPDIGLIGEFDSSLTICGVDYKLSNQKYSVVEDHLPLHEYMSLYDGHQVAIAPLVNTKFNRCKSNLKLLEAGAKGIPLFASEVLPYYNNTDMKVIKYVPDYMFKEHISRYSNQSLIELGEETAEHVRKHYSLVDANLLRKQLFESFQ